MTLEGQLLVEGTDDQHIVWALCKQYQVTQSFSVEETGGIEELFKGLPQRIRDKYLGRLGIVIDADTNLDARWQKVKTLFDRFGYSMPDYPAAGGTIVIYPDEGMPYPSKVGVWLMPNNQTTGIIEDFMQELASVDDILFEEAQTTIQHIEKTVVEDLRFASKDRSKALIHTYLAWQQNPGTPMGLAITKKYFDADAALAQQFINWLNELFN